jgi:N-acetyl-anhydromuramyl-L-alanine amidase AmpD
MRPEVKAWAEENIVWAGNANTNKSSRDHYLPEVIVDHITEGSAESCIDWFTSTGNKESSAHFLVSRKGKVYQFVDIKDKAWTQGISLDMIPKATAEIVKLRQVNPNLYGVGIEHEGVYEETKGALTEAQLNATTWLHAYIIDYVKDNFGITITADRKHIIGHYEVNPVNKPNCPGELFPFNTIIQKLGGIGEQLPFDDIADHWAKTTIVEALSLGLVKGNGTRQFNPDKAATKAELTQVALNLYKMLKK